MADISKFLVGDTEYSVKDAIARAGNPTQYIKSAEVSVDEKTLTLTDNNDNTIEFQGGGGGDVTDVQQNGSSVVDENGVASITVPTALANLSDDSTHRLVTDTEKSTWNGIATDLTTHTSNTSNPHSVTKSQVGLGNVTNDAQVKATEKGVASGVATLDSNAKIPSTQLPDFLLGQVIYGGTVATGAVATLSLNAQAKLGTTSSTITLTNDNTAVTGYKDNEGIYYISSGTLSFAGISFVDGDWLISNGSAWSKIDNTDAVASVNGKTGAVTLNADDISDTSTTNKFVTATEKSTWSGKQDALVSGTNIKTVNSTSLLGSGDLDVKDIFYCTYGTTTYAEITSALSAGKVPVCVYNDRTYIFASQSSTVYRFSSAQSDYVRYVTVNDTSTWGTSAYNFEITSNKVTSISSASTNTQYPSALAVYNAIDAAITTSLGGNY